MALNSHHPNGMLSMSDHTVSLKVYILSISPWYEVGHLLGELRAIQALNFSLVEQRQQGLERLNALNNIPTFSYNLRFLKSGYYVSAYEGQWPRQFTQLRAALSYKERDLKTPGTVGTERSQSFNDAMKAFHSVLTSMVESCGNPEMVHDRDSFEKRYGLNWDQTKNRYRQVSQEIKKLVDDRELEDTFQDEFFRALKTGKAED